ncbi:unnamed protein product [Peronospora belbahrii]|uniref:CN hydrolase domain-containing protein n=1 Tax=Peronospora belbahrii TaxID=622444 RepID=A0ABN8CN90_9STRA|nr:unnamed protein product [Peronospora belbahrii]
MLLVAIILLLVRVWQVVIPLRIKVTRRHVRVMAVLGSGGHTTELLKLIERLKRDVYTPFTFVVAETDKSSQVKTELDWKPTEIDSFATIPRSREAGESCNAYKRMENVAIIYIMFTFGLQSSSTANTVQWSRHLYLHLRGGLLFRVFGVQTDSKIIFCESFARVTHLSLTGRQRYMVRSNDKCYEIDIIINLRVKLFTSHTSTARVGSSTSSLGSNSATVAVSNLKALSTAVERIMTVAATQMSCGKPEENIKKAESLVRIASSRGAQIILLQELFQFAYFPIELNAGNFELATTLKESALVQDGTVLGVTRKFHIGDRLGYNEKYYFTPSDDSFKVWDTRYGKIGVAIGSDQWYPEVARSLVVQGAELLLYPSAMGSNQYDPNFDPRDQWQRVMQGHAAASMVPVICSNRVGAEIVDSIQVTFVGSSFITGQTGEMLKIADRESEGVLVESFDLEKFHVRRASWGLMRDRRPNLGLFFLWTKTWSTPCDPYLLGSLAFSCFAKPTTHEGKNS